MYKLFQNQGLGKLTSHTRHYFESHKRRCVRRYGVYTEVAGEIGVMSGVRWVGGD